jgi:hypothetical protein
MNIMVTTVGVRSDGSAAQIQKSFRHTRTSTTAGQAKWIV